MRRHVLQDPPTHEMGRRSQPAPEILLSTFGRVTIDSMKPTVYVETTVPSYLTAWPSRDVVRAGEQQVTRDWWARRSAYELRVSSLVLLECGAGDAEAAALRLAALDGVPVLAQTPEAVVLAEKLLREVPLPPRAAADALHIAVAAVNGVSFLVTWNCTHIANATTRPRIEELCRQSGYEPPVICTPNELLGGEGEP
jgi:hypothetical protein